MEHASGVPLREKWQEMTGDQQVRCIDAIYRMIKEAVDLEFPAFGSIYFNNNVDSRYRKFLDEDFCIGPHCSSRYWDCNPGEHRYYHRAKPNHGPCKLQWISVTQESYLLRWITRDQDWGVLWWPHRRWHFEGTSSRYRSWEKNTLPWVGSKSPAPSRRRPDCSEANYHRFSD